MYRAKAMSSIQHTIIDIIASTCRLASESVTLDATLKDLDVHSLDAVQVLFEIEDRFDIALHETENHFTSGTVADLVHGVERLLAAKQSQAA